MKNIILPQAKITLTIREFYDFKLLATKHQEIFTFINNKNKNITITANEMFLIAMGYSDLLEQN
jgi:hypothetical protein